MLPSDTETQACGTNRRALGRGVNNDGDALDTHVGAAGRAPSGRAGHGLCVCGAGLRAGKRQDDADRHPGSAESDRDRHRPAPGRDGSGIVALPVRQSVRPKCHGGDDHPVPARPGEGQRRRRRRRSRRRLPNPVDGERRLECRKRAGRARRRGLRPQVPAEPDPGGHGRIRTLDGRDVLWHRAAASAPRSAADDGRPRAADRRLARRLRADPAPRRRVEDRSGPHRHGRFLCGAQC